MANKTEENKLNQIPILIYEVISVQYLLKQHKNNAKTETPQVRNGIEFFSWTETNTHTRKHTHDTVANEREKRAREWKRVKDMSNKKTTQSECIENGITKYYLRKKTKYT